MYFYALANSYIDSTTSPKVEKKKGIRVRYLIRNILGVKTCARVLGWGLGRVASESIIHTDLHKPNNKLVNVEL